MDITKNQLRKQMKSIRDYLPRYEQEQNSLAICERLHENKWYENTDTLLVYASIQSEVCLEHLIQRAWQEQKQVYFPRVKGEDMDFFLVRSKEELLEGSFHVMEPTGNKCFLSEQPAPILVPAVSFSRTGERIGYGKGYYDRYLCRFPNLVRIGICHEEQMVDYIPSGPHDKPMDAIVTQNEIIVTGKRFSI